MRKKERLFLSNDILKMIALLAMLIDHVGAALVLQALSVVDAGSYEAWYIFYRMLRNLGRTSFPIYAFLLAEGFFYTHSRKKYLGRLALFALLSEMPYDMAFHGSIFYGSDQNVFLTLVLGFLVIWGLEKCKEICLAFSKRRGMVTNILSQCMLFAVSALLVFSGAAFAKALHMDYGAYGVWLIVLFYFGTRLNVSRILTCALGYLLFLWEPFCFGGFLLILFYNGKRKLQGKELQYFFYLFYPIHLLILGLLRVVFFHS